MMIKTEYNNDMENAEKYDKTGKAVGWIKKGALILFTALTAVGLYSKATSNDNDIDNGNDDENEEKE